MGRGAETLGQLKERSIWILLGLNDGPGWLSVERLSAFKYTVNECWERGRQSVCVCFAVEMADPGKADV